MSFHNNQHMVYGYHFGTYHPGAYRGELCFDSAQNESRWCTYGCCGDLDTECCHASVALIVSASVLSLIVICCVVAVCCCCCLRRRAATSGQVLDLHPPLPPPSAGGAEYTSEVSSRGQTDPSLPYPTQTYPPGCYAPPAYSAVQRSSGISSSSSSCPACSIPIPPPPYSREEKGHDNRGFKVV